MKTNDLMNNLNNLALNGSSCEKQLASLVIKYIKENKKIRDIKTFAAEGDFSQSTIYRFAIALGFPSFVIFKHFLNDFTVIDTQDNVIKDIYTRYDESTKKVFKHLLHKSKNVHFVFGKKDCHLQTLVEYKFENFCEKPVVPIEQIGAKTLLICITLDGHSLIVHRALEKAKMTALFSKEDTRVVKNDDNIFMPIIAPYAVEIKESRNFLDTAFIVALTDLFN